MKQLSIITLALAIALLALMLAPGAAFADNPPHGGFTATADGCAGCHRAHTAAAGRLLINTGYALCMTCHGVTTGGASTDVKDGLFVGTTPNGSLKGGGLDNATMDHAWTGTATAGATTSKHAVVGGTLVGNVTAYASGTVWGNGAITTTAYAGFAAFPLNCTSCHDPHGKAGLNSAPTYRLLRYTPSGTGPAFGSANVPDVTTAVTPYTATVGTGKYYGQLYPDTGVTGGNGSLIDDISGWCATCHTRIHATGLAPGNTSSGDAIFNFRHKTAGVSVENNFGTAVTFPAASPGCVSCHVAHGSTATMGTWSSQVDAPGTTGTTHLDSALLRVDNRGVCELCHNK